MPGCFVTGTDTGVGKSVLSAAIVAALRARGVPVRALKPVITGLDDPVDPVWPPDHQLLAGLTGQDPSEVAPIAFSPAVSPHLAAEMAGRELAGESVAAAVHAARAAAAAAGETLVVEGVGGLLVPFNDRYSVRDLARDARLPVVIAARPGLGTISHTLLTLEAARGAGLDVRAVVLTPWSAAPEPIELSNRETISRIGGVPVTVLPFVQSPTEANLASAGEALPVLEWTAP